MFPAERKCFIHIGAPKTGSTLIQRFCAARRETLATRGVLYPAAGLRAGGHHDLAFLLNGGYPDWATPQDRTLQELQSDLACAAADHAGNLLLSSENFYLFPEPERLMRLLGDCAIAPAYRPVVVVYLRNQADAHQSWYNQRVKAQGYTGDLDSSIKDAWSLWNYAIQLERWASVFGPQNLVVRLYDRERFSGGALVRDFLDAIEAPSQDLALPPEDVNAGLNRSLLEFQRALNALPLPAAEKRRFHAELIELSTRSAGSGVFDESPLLDPVRRKAIMSRYARDNAIVARRYFDRFRLFDHERAEGHEAGPSSEALSPERLAAIVGWLLIRGPAAPDRGGGKRAVEAEACLPATR